MGLLILAIILDFSDSFFNLIDLSLVTSNGYGSGISSFLSEASWTLSSFSISILLLLIS